MGHDIASKYDKVHPPTHDPSESAKYVTELDKTVN